MRYNFWSKLHFYMKFLKYVSHCTCVQKFSYRHPPFVFLSHSIAVAALSEISHVACRALDDPFWALFYHLVCRSHFNPQTIQFFGLGSWNNIFWALIQEKMIIPSLFHSQVFVLLYKFETSWTLLGVRSWPGVKFFFLPSQGSPNFAFHEPAPDLTC